MPKQVAYLLGLLLCVIALITVGLVFFPPQAGIALEGSYESSVFRFRYPEDWSYQIPQTNMLFLVSPEITRQEAGASVTVQRSLRLSAEAEGLESALNFYLERGPLRSDRAWALLGEIAASNFKGRPSLHAVVEGAEDVDSLTMRSEITITQANNGFIYIFTVTAPLEQWANFEPSFQAILGSLEILE